VKGWILSHIENSASVALLLEACRVHGHRVDLDSAREGPLLIEVKDSPGLAGMSLATGRDLAGDIVHLVEKSVSLTVASAA
jgi:hypothetical protein